MFTQNLFGFGIRGYEHYDWKPRPNERLICQCPEDCVIVLKRIGTKTKQVGTVPTELQRVFREFLIHGGSIDVICTSNTYKRALKKGKEIVVVYKLKGPKTHHPLRVAFNELKAVVDELKINDLKIGLAPVQIAKLKTSNICERKGKCVNKKKRKEQNLVKDGVDETSDEGSGGDTVDFLSRKVGGYGGKTKVDAGVFPNNHRFSMGHLFTKPIDDSMCESLVKTLSVEMKSVGLLIYGKELGTVFRVGRTYLMTARHVVKDIVDPQGTGQPDFSRLADRAVYVTFSESAFERNNKEYHLKAFIRYGIQYDFAVLEISDPDELLPKALQLNYRDTYNLSKVWITGYGHTSSKKTLDPSCQIITPTSKIIKDAISSFYENKTYYKKELIKDGKDPTFADALIEYGFNGYKNPERLLLHAVLQHGGSGSPVFASEDSRTLKVIGIFTGGLPEFYFHLSEELKRKYNGQHRFEIALKMCYVHESIKAEDPELASDIFSL